VADLRRDVERTHLPLPIAGADDALALRTRLLDQLDDHLLPRLRELSAPAVVVVAGSTGAGKSTLMNSLLGQEVSAAGVLRPTTREPVLAHHSADAELLASHPLLEIVSVVVHDAVPRGLTLVDAPDLDSLLTSNRATAHRLLEAADLWIFLTTAARYGDALPWDVLAEAAERGVSMAMVLNRVPAAALAPIRTDLMARLRDRGMAAVPLFLIPDLGPHEGLLDPATVAPIRRWLAMVAGPDRARSVILRTQRGALRRLQPWVGDLVDAVQLQVDARVGLERVVRAAVRAPADAAAAGVLGGGVVAGPVRARWASFAGMLTGRATSRRGRAARADALEHLASDLRATVVVMLTGARRAGDSALAEALGTTDVPGAEAVPGAGVAPADVAPSATVAPAVAPAVDAAPRPEESAADWLLSGVQVVRTQAESRDRKVARPARRLRAAFGEDGSGTLLCLAAAGLGAASVQVTGALGSAVTQDALTTLRSDLANRAAAQAMDAARPALTFLGSTDLADDATAALRVRLAVLKGLR
jgi:energy-coupling factor transporter ATP-binding protein EcfA2